MVNGTLFPLIDIWIKNPTDDNAKKAKDEIDGVIPLLLKLLAKIGPDPQPGKRPCSSGGLSKRNLMSKRLFNPFQLVSDVIHSIACAVNCLENVKLDIDIVPPNFKEVQNYVTDLEYTFERFMREVGGEEDDGEEEPSSSSSSSSQCKTATVSIPLGMFSIIAIILTRDHEQVTDCATTLSVSISGTVTTTSTVTQCSTLSACSMQASSTTTATTTSSCKLRLTLIHLTGS